MIVIGTEVVENYLADHVGHKGDQSCTIAIRSMARHCGPRPVAQPRGCENFISKGEHSQGRSGHFQYQGQRLSTGCGPPVSGRSPDDPVLRDPRRVRQNRCGDRVMDATLVLIDSDAELVRARVLVDRLWKSDLPTDIASLQAQARLIAAYEESKWPRRRPSAADLIRHLMD